MFYTWAARLQLVSCSGGYTANWLLDFGLLHLSRSGDATIGSLSTCLSRPYSASSSFRCIGPGFLLVVASLLYLAPPNKVYIGGLPDHTRPEDLQNCFGKIGNIATIELKWGLGYGFVEFDTREAAEESVARYHEGYFMGNKIRVEPSHSHAVKAVTGQDVVVPCTIRPHTIVLLVITITIHPGMLIHIETNIQDTLARGMVAITTLLRLHPLQREIIGEPQARRVTVVTTLFHVVSTMTIACEVLHHHSRCLVTTELDITSLRGTTLRVRHRLIVTRTIGALLIQKTEACHTQRTAVDPELLLVPRHLEEKIMTRCLGAIIRHRKDVDVRRRHPLLILAAAQMGLALDAAHSVHLRDMIRDMADQLILTARGTLALRGK
ncbi:hypothetical protein J3R83DRAFT_6984 [Lanmaoa asiatica]|nr:hypothetical protein J3R83DRAFT_6984 [Lanmaoa asiatica]